MVSYIRGNDNLDSSNVATDTELASAGPSTNYGAVGTYILGYLNKNPYTTVYNGGDTVAGSSIYVASLISATAPGTGSYGAGGGINYSQRETAAMSGTWRMMGPNELLYSNSTVTYTAFVRIS